MGLTDWLAATFFVSDDDIATHDAVNDAQQSILDRQHQDGTRDWWSYEELSGEVAADNDLKDFQAANSGVTGLLGNTWKIWLPVLALVFVALFLWLGGLSWIRGILAKKK